MYNIIQPFLTRYTSTSVITIIHEMIFRVFLELIGFSFGVFSWKPRVESSRVLDAPVDRGGGPQWGPCRGAAPVPQLPVHPATYDAEQRPAGASHQERYVYLKPQFPKIDPKMMTLICLGRNSPSHYSESGPPRSVLGVGVIFQGCFVGILLAFFAIIFLLWNYTCW